MLALAVRSRSAHGHFAERARGSSYRITTPRNDRIAVTNRALDRAAFEGKSAPKADHGTHNTAQGYNLNRDT